MFNKKLIISEIAKIRKELAEDLKTLHGRLSNQWNIVSEHTKKVEELKQYIECDTCGHLVNKQKAKVEWEMRDKHKFNAFGFTQEEVLGIKPEKEAVKTYKCLHCQKGEAKKEITSNEKSCFCGVTDFMIGKLPKKVKGKRK